MPPESLLRGPGLVLAMFLCLLPGAREAAAQAPAPVAPASTAAAGPAFDPVQATEAYLARLSPAERQRSDAYYEGGYWLQLWSFLWELGVAALLLAGGFSVRMRDLAERLARRPFLRTLLYAMQYVLVTAVLTFPLTLYTDFFREHRYGLSNQAFGPWMRDVLVGLGLALVLGSLALTGFYAVLRRASRTWWLWGSGLAVVLLAVALLVAPVFIAPLFNTYTELTDPALAGPILSMARDNGVPAEHVYVYDASRQSKRIGANVSGLAGTLRISLNDNLLKRCSKPAVRAVMGHEIGHYVLHHTYDQLVAFGLVFFAGFAWLRWSGESAFRRWGPRLGVRGFDDPAGLPLLAALVAVFFFVATPVLNTVIRSGEAEADAFALNASGEPDGFAEATLLLGEYRKLHPGPHEEWLFFDHPSGYRRILGAMQWKAEHLPGKPGAAPGEGGTLD